MPNHAFHNSVSFGSTIIALDAVDSTHNYAATMLRTTDLAEGTVVMSQFQEKGRGQRGSMWQSAPGQNLLMTLVLKPQRFSASRQFLINQAICIGIVNAVREKYQLTARVKWPNDILIGEEKVAGVLIENSVRGEWIEYCLAGVGLNVGQSEFPDDFKATSLKLQLRTAPELKTVLGDLLPFVESAYRRLDQPQLIREEYFELLYGTDEMLFYEEGDSVYTARISGIGEHGELQLQCSDGRQLVRLFKQVRLLGKNG